MEKLLCDLHIHTKNSDGDLSIREVVDLYGKEGFDVIAITDHLMDKKSLKRRKELGKNLKSIFEDNIKSYFNEINKEKDRAIEKYGMLVIPGIEITENTRGFHIVGLGVTNYINPNVSVKNITEEIRNNGGVAIAAHPVNKFSSGRHEGNTFLWDNHKEFREYMDAWEIGNREDFFAHVAKEGLNYVANSDLHSKNNINSWKTVLDCEKDVESIKKAIKNGNTEVMFYNGKSI